MGKSDDGFHGGDPAIVADVTVQIPDYGRSHRSAAFSRGITPLLRGIADAYGRLSITILSDDCQSISSQVAPPDGQNNATK